MIDLLNQAIADGVRMVQIRGETINYQTTENLIKARDDMKRELAAQKAADTPPARPPSRVTYYSQGGRGFQ